MESSWHNIYSHKSTYLLGYGVSAEGREIFLHESSYAANEKQNMIFYLKKDFAKP